MWDRIFGSFLSQIDRRLFVTQKSIKTYDGDRVDVLVDDLGDDLDGVDSRVAGLLEVDEVDEPRRDAPDALRFASRRDICVQQISRCSRSWELRCD